MSYEMIGESIKSATSIRLGQLFNNPIRYKENITNQQYPNFHIIQVNTNVTPRQTSVESAFNHDKKRVQIDYLMNIQYRVANNLESVSNLRQQLEAVGLKLLTEFDSIQLDLPVWVKNKRYEIVDGILQFFFNVTVFATMEQQNEEIMGDMNLEENLIGEPSEENEEETPEENEEEEE